MLSKPNGFFNWLLKIVCTYVQNSSTYLPHMTLLRISLGTSRVSEGYGQHAYTLWHRDRLHRIRLGGTVGYRRMGRNVGSIGSIVGRVDIGVCTPLPVCGRTSGTGLGRSGTDDA